MTVLLLDDRENRMNKELKSRLRAIALALEGKVEQPTWRALRLPTPEVFDERFRGRSDDAIILDCLRGAFMALSRLIGFSIRADDPDVTDAKDAFVYSAMELQCWMDEIDEHVERVLPLVTGLVADRPATFSGLTADSSTALSVLVFRAVIGALSRAASGDCVGPLHTAVGRVAPRLHEEHVRARSKEIMPQVASVLGPLPWPVLTSAIRIELCRLMEGKARRRRKLGKVTSPQADAHAFNLKLHSRFPKVVAKNGDLTDHAAQVLSALPHEDDEEELWLTEGQIVDKVDLVTIDIVKKLMPKLLELQLIRREKGRYGACHTKKGAVALVHQRLAIDWTGVFTGTGSGTD